MPKTTPYRQILAYVSFGPQDAQVIQQACALAKANGAQLRLLHIVDVDPSLDGSAGLTPAQEAGAYESVAMVRLQAMTHGHTDIQFECHVRVGRPALAFQQFTRDWMPQLVVTARQSQHMAQGPWDALILNNPSASWLGNLMDWSKSRSADMSVAAGTA